MRVYTALWELNVRVPGQLSIFGYSSYPGSQLLLPPLTTIDTQLKVCASMALERLRTAKECFRTGVTPFEIFRPYRLIERESVAVPNCNLRQRR